MALTNDYMKKSAKAKTNFVTLITMENDSCIVEPLVNAVFGYAGHARPRSYLLNGCARYSGLKAR